MKKILLHNIIFLAFLLPYTAYAQVVITEIMYDPIGADSGHEWIEVYNSGTSSLSVAKWKLSIGGNSHKLFAVSGGMLVSPNTYVVIAANPAKFLIDYPDVHTQVVRSSFTLSNSSGVVALYSARSTILDSVSYDSSTGGFGDGNSLQRLAEVRGSNAVAPHTPSPGATMPQSVLVPPALPKNIPKKLSRNSKKRSAPKGVYVAAALPTVTDPVEEIATSSGSGALLQSKSDDSLWWYALAALMVLVVGIIFASKRAKQSEWEIVEETSEDV
jgi:hypothetical protein